MDKSYLSKVLVHDAISVGLDTLADKYMPSDSSSAIVDIELHTRFSGIHHRRTIRAIGLSIGDELDSVMFWKTRHKLSVRSIKLAPGTDLLLGDWRMFGKTFKVHNGSDRPQTFRFFTYRPTIHYIKVVEGDKDGKVYDSYNWGWYIFNTHTFPFILLVIILVAVIIIIGVKPKNNTVVKIEDNSKNHPLKEADTEDQ